MSELREKVKQYSAVFVGPVRNCGPFLEKVINNIERIGSLFKDYSCVFVESDSVDNSLSILEKFASRNENVYVLTLGNIEPKIPSRTMRIAAARNIGIQFCEERGLLDKHDFYFQLCVDDVNENEIDLDGILSCFKYDLNIWDGMTANQVQGYYDLWTVRKEGWLTHDCWYEIYRNKPSYMSHEEWKRIMLDCREIKIPRNYGLIEVDAAHGGLSIYKSSVAKGCRYKGYNEQNNFEESDIMQFCRDIKSKGGRIYINSELVNKT